MHFNRPFLILFLLLAIVLTAACAPSMPWLQPSTQIQPVSTFQAEALQGCSQTLNIAHRGARSLAPENTLAAARKALAVGADMWELDVSMAADGDLFVIHDATLARTSDVAEVFPDRQPWPNTMFTLAEIRRLDFGSWFVAQDPFGQIASGRVSQAEQESYRGEPAPTLQEALIFTRDNDWRVDVEIKDLDGTPGDAVVVEKVVALIQALNMADHVVVSSFNQGYLKRVKTAGPEIVTAVLVSKPNSDPAGLLRRLGARIYAPRVTAIRPREIRRLRDQGFDVYVWTVDDVSTMRTLIKAGVSGIFTDFPQDLEPLLMACR